MITENSIVLKHLNSLQDALLVNALSTACSLGNCITPLWERDIKSDGVSENELTTIKIENIDQIDEVIGKPDFVSFQVSSKVGKGATLNEKSKLLNQFSQYIGVDQVPGVPRGHIVTTDYLIDFIDNYLPAIKEVHFMYSVLKAGNSRRIPCEISLSESEITQDPIDLFFIIQLLIDHKIIFNTIEPKITQQTDAGVAIEQIQEYCHLIGEIFKMNGINEIPKLSLSISDIASTESLASIFKQSECGLHAKQSTLLFHQVLLNAVNEIRDEGGHLGELINSILDKNQDRIAVINSFHFSDMNIVKNHSETYRATSDLMLLFEDFSKDHKVEFESFNKVLTKKIYNNYIKPIFG